MCRLSDNDDDDDDYDRLKMCRLAEDVQAVFVVDSNDDDDDHYHLHHLSASDSSSDLFMSIFE